MRSRSSLTVRSVIAALVLVTAPMGAQARIERGDKGAEVTKVQEALKALGVYDGAVDGKFGAKMEAAVKKYQEQKKVTADGIVGKTTLDLLFPVATPADKTLRPGASGEAVTVLQNLLNAKGATVKVDGKYGKGTTDAVKAFQTKAGLSPVDGTAGPKTWAKLRA